MYSVWTFLSFKINGKSAVNSSAIFTHSKVKVSAKHLTTHCYKQDEPIHSRFLPKNAPSKLKIHRNFGTLLVDEKNSNAQLSHRIILTSSRLSADENKVTLRDYVQSTFCWWGMCADGYSLINTIPHAHIYSPQDL